MNDKIRANQDPGRPKDGGRLRKAFGDIPAESSKIDVSILMGLLVFIGIAATVGGVVLPLAGNAFGSKEVPVEISADNFDIKPIESREVVEADLASEYVTGILNADTTSYAIWSVGEALQALAVAVAALGLFKLARSSYSGDPFTRANATWLNVAALAMAVGFVGNVIGAVADLELTRGAGYSTSAGFSFAWLGPMFLFGTFARVWSHGVALKEETALTV